MTIMLTHLRGGNANYGEPLRCRTCDPVADQLLDMKHMCQTMIDIVNTQPHLRILQMSEISLLA